MTRCAGQVAAYGGHGSDACTCAQVPKATCLLLKALAEWIAAQLEPRANPTARAIIVSELRVLVDIPAIPAEDTAAVHSPGNSLANDMLAVADVMCEDVASMQEFVRLRDHCKPEMGRAPVLGRQARAQHCRAASFSGSGGQVRRRAKGRDAQVMGGSNSG